MTLFFQSLLDGVLMGGVYALAALGLTLIFGVMNITNFAHGALMSCGMYAVWALSTALGVSPYLALPAAALAMFGIGMAMQNFLITPIERAPTHNQLLLTLGVSIILENALMMIFSPTPRNLTVPGFDRAMSIGALSVSKPKLVAFVCVCVIAGAVWLLLRKTYIGKAIRAAASDREGAALCGVVIRKINAFAFGLGALCAGAAGALLAPMMYVTPTLGGTFQLKCFVIAVLGGMGSIGGALASGLIIGVVEAMGASYLGGSWSELLIYAVFILTLLLRPNGLFAKEGRA